MDIKFGEEKRVYKGKRHQYRAEKLLPKGDFKVLDLGAGWGEFSDIMKKKYGYDVACVDGNEAFTEDTQKRGYESYAVDLENESLPFADNSFDGVISLEVIEHLFNTELYLSEIQRVLKPDGWAVISTPNYNFWKCRLEHLFGKLYTGPHSRHKRFFSFSTLVQVLKEAGFTIDDYMVIGHLPFIPKNIKTKMLPDILGKTSVIRVRNDHE